MKKYEIKKCVVVIKKNWLFRDGYIIAKGKGYKPIETWVVRSIEEAENFQMTYPEVEIIDAT